VTHTLQIMFITRSVPDECSVVKVVLWSRGAHLTKTGWSKPHTHSDPTNLALYRHKITPYRFNQGASNGSGGAEPPNPLHYNHRECWRAICLPLLTPSCHDSVHIWSSTVSAVCSGTEVVVRACSPIAAWSGCREVSYEGHSATTCFCDSFKCNRQWSETQTYK